MEYGGAHTDANVVNAHTDMHPESPVVSRERHNSDSQLLSNKREMKGGQAVIQNLGSFLKPAQEDMW